MYDELSRWVCVCKFAERLIGTDRQRETAKEDSDTELRYFW